MPNERVLICGAGVAGSIVAFWLAKHDFEVVVIERSRAEKKAGQGIEIEEPALQVVKEMGILDKLEARKTGEEGFNVVDEQSRSCGLLKTGVVSLTGALELMRGDLTEVLYQAADESPNVTYHFQTSIQSLKQTGDKVIVEMSNRETKTTWSEEFDFAIGADGVKSRTRDLAMGSAEKLGHIKHIGAYVAYFSIPKEEHDWPYSRLCHFTNRRTLMTRPVGKNSSTTSGYIVQIADDIPALNEANATGDRMKQKEAWAAQFRETGWETPRIIGEMMKAENFYSDELVQVKLPKWSEGRVALVGDSCWAPTPFTGEGNQLAILGAWVLAQELSRNRSPVAFEQYEKRFRPYVETAQSIPLRGYAPYLVNPQTAWGIWFVRRFFGLLQWGVAFSAWTGLTKLLPEDTHPKFDLEVGKSEEVVET